MQWLLALVATLASAAFAASVLAQWWRRRRAHQLAWGVSLVMFALGSAALAAGTRAGWDPLTYRVYYLFGALLTVPVLAVGTLELLAGRVVARAYLAGVAVFAVAAVALLVAAPIEAAALAAELPEGADVLPPGVRVLAAVGNGVGTLIVVGGALASVVAAARADRAGWYRQPRVQGTALIAAGVLLAAAGGAVAAVGRSAGLALSLAAGAAVMYAGFRRTAARPARRQAAPVATGP